MQSKAMDKQGQPQVGNAWDGAIVAGRRRTWNEGETTSHRSNSSSKSIRADALLATETHSLSKRTDNAKKKQTKGPRARPTVQKQGTQ